MLLFYYTTLPPSWGSAWCGRRFVKPFFSTVTKYPSSLVLADQSLACGYLVWITCWCSSQGVFSPKFRVFIRSHVSEATSPLRGAGGVVFGVYILWVSNGAPRRPLDASRGRPSLTSYNKIVSIPLWPKLDFSKSGCVKLTEVCFAFLI
jgi:hypothetical protein